MQACLFKTVERIACRTQSLLTWVFSLFATAAIRVIQAIKVTRTIRTLRTIKTIRTIEVGSATVGP